MVKKGRFLDGGVKFVPDPTPCIRWPLTGCHRRDQNCYLRKVFLWQIHITVYLFQLVPMSVLHLDRAKRVDVIGPDAGVEPVRRHPTCVDRQGGLPLTGGVICTGHSAGAEGHGRLPQQPLSSVLYVLLSYVSWIMHRMLSCASRGLEKSIRLEPRT